MVKKKNAIIRVWIDSKEQDFVKKSKIFFDNKKIQNEIKSLTDGDLKVLLQTGDFFVIERKRYDDFAQSYIKKHIQDQAIRMNENCQYYCCIIHGDISDIKRAAIYNPALSKIRESSVRKMHQKLELVYKLPCFFVKNDVQYFNKVIELSEMLVKSKGINKIVKTQVSVEDNTPLSILMAKSDIGQKTAQLLLSEFGSPKNVLEAPREELLQINGIGDITVTKIKELKEAYEYGKKI